jgi:hypothetical protein
LRTSATRGSVVSSSDQSVIVVACHPNPLPLPFQFADKAALDKAWDTDIKPWQMRDDVRKLAEFETFSIEGVESK